RRLLHRPGAVPRDEPVQYFHLGPRTDVHRDADDTMVGEPRAGVERNGRGCRCPGGARGSAATPARDRETAVDRAAHRRGPRAGPDAGKPARSGSDGVSVARDDVSRGGAGAWARRLRTFPAVPRDALPAIQLWR